MKNGKKVVQNGETVLMDKAKVPVKYIEVPEKVVNQAISNKPREKKPLSEKQKENLQRLIELNKKRREEKLAAIRVNVDELGEIPEDKVVVRVVKGKGAGRPRKQNPTGRAQAKQTQSGRPDRRESESENEVVEEPYGSSASEEPSGCLAIPRDGILKLKRESKKVARRPLSEEEEEEEEKTPPKKAKPAPKKGKIVAPRAREQSTKAGITRKPRTYFSETSETSGVDADSDSDSEDEEVVQRKVQKYVEKTKARMEALKQIEQQLKPQNKYAGMSIF